MEEGEFIAHLKLLGYRESTNPDKSWATWEHPNLPKVHAAWLNGCVVQGMDDGFPTFDQAWAHIWRLANG